MATGALAAAVAPSVMAEDQKKKKVAPAPAVKGPNDRLRIAVLGVNGRGKSHIEEIMKISEQSNVEVAVLCDPDMNVLQQRAAELAARNEELTRFSRAATGRELRMIDLKREIKELLVGELNLAGRDPAAIDDDALLFGPSAKGGLGLDSLDALQIAMILEEKFGVRVPEGDAARPIFRSVATLAEFVAREGSTNPSRA